MVLPRVIGNVFPSAMNGFTFITSVIAGMIFAQYNVFKKLDNIKIRC